MTGRHELALEQHREALLVILEACITTPQQLNAMAISDLRELPALEGLDTSILKRMLTLLVTTQLLWRPPHLVARSARYVTTALGQEFIRFCRLQDVHNDIILMDINL